MFSNSITLLLLFVCLVYVTNKLKEWVRHTQGQHGDLISFFLGAIVKLPKATLSFIISVRSSVRPSALKISAHTRKSFVRTYRGVFVYNCSVKLKSHENLSRIQGSSH
jgi:hypothetical protein